MRLTGNMGGMFARVSLLILLAAAGASGCLNRPTEKKPERPDIPPLPVQQMKAYPEAVTGRFVSLADFEDSPLAAGRGHQQVGCFSVTPLPGAELKFAVNITRTGTGALEAILPPRAALVYQLPEIHDVSSYSLLAMAVYSPAIRDDLKVYIATRRAGWESLPVLLRAGWNNVLIDLERIKAMPDFEAKGVRFIRLSFADAAEPVKIYLDDVMLVDNQREIGLVPPGMRLVKKGLDYELSLPDRRGVRIKQGDDGLWRLSPEQIVVELGAPSAAARPEDKADLPPPASGPAREDIRRMGARRVGEVEVLESNSLRLRLANTWFFPTEAGQWASLSVRQVRWEYTFYADGRCITDLIVNNAGGEDIAWVRLTAPSTGVWSDGRESSARPAEAFAASAGRWIFFSPGQGPNRPIYQANYLRPARSEIKLGAKELVDEDVNGNGFDESQGCYRFRARAGHCRFLMVPPAEGLCDATIRVAGKWSGPVTANCEGMAIRELMTLKDGSVLFQLPGTITRPTWVEVTGLASPGVE